MQQDRHRARGQATRRTAWPPDVAPKRRCLAVWLAATVLCWGAGSLCLQMGLEVWQASGARGTFEDVLVQAGAVAGVASLAWLWSVASLTVVAAARGRVRHTPGSPVGAARRVVLALCGVALTAAVAAPSHAGNGAGAADLSGLPYPDRASISSAEHDLPVAAATALPATVASSAPRDTYVVRPGDTLWGIAAATFPGTAGVSEVDERWREIHRLNRALLGDDPHLIHPDQVLTLPTTHEGDRS